MQETCRIRTLVVEDEALMRRNVVGKIQAANAAFEVVGTAENGRAALALVDDLRPEAVFCDVSMPVMDGLELADRLSHRHPGVKLVIISGYREFDYARRALEYGVKSYLLKPIEPHALGDVLDQLRREILDERQRALRTALQASLQGRSAALRDEETRYLLLHAMIGHRFGASVPAALAARFALLWEGALPGLKAEFDVGWQVFDGVRENERYFVQHVVPASTVDPCALAGQLMCQLRKGSEGYPVNVCACTQPVQSGALFGARKDCCSAQYEHLLIGQSGACGAEDPIAESGALLDTQQLQLMRTLAQYGDTASLMCELSKLLESWSGRGIRQMEFESAVGHLLWMLNGCLPQKDDGTVQAQRRMIFVELAGARELGEVLSCVRQGVENLFSTGRLMDRGEGALAVKMKDYLREHLAESLNMEALAKRFGFHMAHLTRVFKKCTGTTLLQYQTSLRIERAIQLMREHPGMDIRSIAESVGYDDAHYFSRVFKQIHCMSPQHYRDRL